MPPKNDPGVGGDYEVHFLAYLSLIYLLNDEVEDFDIESNAKDVGKFDDCVVRATFKGGQEERVCVQLKHKENPHIPRAELEKDKGNFSIQSYYHSFKEIKDKDNTNLIYILFTNGTINVDKLTNSEKFAIDKSSNLKGFHKILQSTKDVYQFSDKSQSNDEQYKTFLQNFYFYSNQENEKQLEQAIYKIFEEEFGSNQDFANNFIKFFRDFHKGRFTDKKIQKRTVEIHLIHSLSKPFMLNVKSDAFHDDAAFQHFEKLISLFDFILVQDENLQTTLVKTPSVIREDFVRWARDNKFIKPKGNDDELENLYCCCELKIPFYLKYNEKSFESINALARFNQNSNSNNFKFVLVGSETSLAHFIKNENTLSNLSDVEKKNRDVYENIINNIAVSLEGRKTINLKDFIRIDDDLKEVITTDLLVNALIGDGVIKVGKAKAQEKLPEFYIQRTVYQFGVSLETVKQNRNILFVIHCGSYLEFVKQSLGNDCITLDELKSNRSELNDESILKNFGKSGRFKKVHHLYVNLNNDKPNVDWFRSCETGNSVNSNDIEIYSLEQKNINMTKKVTSNFNANLRNSLNLPLLSEQEIDTTKLLKKLPVKEEEIFSHFTNNVELICGRPGVGKSTLMSNLRLNCSENYWCIRVNFKDIDSHFENELSYNEFCDKIYYIKDDSRLIKKIKDVFYRHDKIIFFFDGFDELDSDKFKNFLTLLDEIQADKKCKVWISTRLNCRHFFARKIKASAIEFEDLQESDQRCFIESRLTPHCESSVRLKVINDVFESLYVSKNKDILGTPLLLHIVTDILINAKLDEIPKDFFILTKMYERFFEGKISHYYAKSEAKYEISMKKILKTQFELQYETAALKSSLTSELFDSLQLKVDENTIDLLKNDPIGIIIETQIDADNISFKFHHQTYAEYFAAKWLVKNIGNIPYDTRAFLLEERYENLKLMFDMLIAEDCKAHIAVLYKNVEMLKKCNENDITQKDKLGRTVLHLLFSNGEKFPLQSPDCLIENNEVNEEIFYFEPDSNIRNLLARLVNPEISLLDKDKFLNKSAVDYAISRFSVSSLAHIAKLDKFSSDLEEQLHDKIFLTLFYSLSCGYLDMLKVESVAKYLRQNLDSTTFVKVLINSEIYTMTPLLIASVKGHLDVVKELLSNNADVNLTKNDGASALLIASAKGHFDIVKELLSNNADVNLTMNNGASPLHIASQIGHLDIVKELLSNNADVNLTMNNGASPLHIASQIGHLDIVKELLSNNADVNLTMNDEASPLYIASALGHLDIVKELLSNNAKVNLTMNDGASPLHIASAKGHFDIVKELLSNNADVNLTMNNGASALHIASAKGHLDIVKELLSNNADVNLTMNNGASPLHIASAKGHLDIVKELLSNNAKVNLTTNDGASPLYIASQNGHLDIVKELLSNNADVNLRMSDGASPLYIASQNGHLDIVKELLSNNADVNLRMSDGASPLYIASQTGHLDIVKELLSNNAMVNLTKIDGASPLLVASQNGHLDIVKELLSNNADINLTMNDGASPLHIASFKGHLDIVIELLSNNADVNLTTINGVSPLHIASQNGHLGIVKELISKNADVNLTMNDRSSPLLVASQNGHLDIVKELLTNNADVNLRMSNGASPLYIASQNGHFDIVKKLLTNNADVNLTRNHGASPLHIASQIGHLDIVKELLSNNADVNLTTNHGASPLHIAFQNGHHDIVKELLSNIADIKQT